LKRFGEISVITAKEKIQSKLSDIGIVHFFVGYPSNHANDVYRLMNPSTKNVIASSDVICLNKTCGKRVKSKENLAKVDDDTSDSELDIGTSKNSFEQKGKPNDMTR
jgi:hypothetical protein